VNSCAVQANNALTAFYTSPSGISGDGRMVPKNSRIIQGFLLILVLKPDALERQQGNQTSSRQARQYSAIVTSLRPARPNPQETAPYRWVIYPKDGPWDQGWQVARMPVR